MRPISYPLPPIRPTQFLSFSLAPSLDQDSFTFNSALRHDRCFLAGWACNDTWFQNETNIQQIQRGVCHHVNEPRQVSFHQLLLVWQYHIWQYHVWQYHVWQYHIWQYHIWQYLIWQYHVWQYHVWQYHIWQYHV